jgi:transcriptional regulator with XRE-family HTH domain
MPEKDPHVIGARIARRRHQLDWSQVELARRLDVSPSTVANWERGASYPKKKWGKVEQVLGISLDSTPEAEEPGLPTPEELDALREHMREVLGEESGPLEEALDAAVSGGRPGRRGRGAGAAPWSARRRASRPS